VVARSRPMFARRRTSVLRVVLLAAGVLLVPALLAAAPIDTWSGVGSSAAEAPAAAMDDGEPSAAEATRGAADPAEEAEDLPVTPAFATVDAVTLHLPAAEVVLVGFHEASSRESQPFGPVGRLRDHQNTTKFDAPADVPEGPPYVVLSSRGRPYPATSAIDVLLEEDEPVRSPVTGTVVDVRSYHLYGKHADQRIEIAPGDAPEQRIVMIHLDGVSVRVGDEVVVGETVVAGGARVFPFGSHIDRYTEPDRFPHVHYEIKRATADEADEAAEAEAAEE
jgi:biotin carboxyl carrier protein